MNTSGADERHGHQDTVREAVRLHRRTARDCAAHGHAAGGSADGAVSQPQRHEAVQPDSRHRLRSPPQLTSAPHDWSIGVSYHELVGRAGGEYGNAEHAGHRQPPGRSGSRAMRRERLERSTSIRRARRSTDRSTRRAWFIRSRSRLMGMDIAWYNDSSAATVPGYMVSAPHDDSRRASLPYTISNSVTVGGDDRINVGITSRIEVRAGEYLGEPVLATRILSGVSVCLPGGFVGGRHQQRRCRIRSTNPTTSHDTELLRDPSTAPSTT